MVHFNAVQRAVLSRAVLFAMCDDAESMDQHLRQASDLRLACCGLYQTVANSARLLMEQAPACALSDAPLSAEELAAAICRSQYGQMGAEPNGVLDQLEFALGRRTVATPVPAPALLRLLILIQAGILTQWVVRWNAPPEPVLESLLASAQMLSAWQQDLAA